MIISISVAFIALAFFALVVYLIRTLITLRSLLSLTERKMHSIGEQWQHLCSQLTSFLQTNEEIAKDVKGKLKALDTVFQCIDLSTQALASWHSEKFLKKEQEKELKKKTISTKALQIIELLGLCAAMIKSIKKGENHET